MSNEELYIKDLELSNLLTQNTILIGILYKNLSLRSMTDQIGMTKKINYSLVSLIEQSEICRNHEWVLQENKLFKCKFCSVIK